MEQKFPKKKFCSKKLCENMSAQAKVIMIPWQHAFDSSAHADIVKFIRSLPKNSIIALEINEQELHRAQKFASFMDERLGVPENVVSAASVEIVFECEKRNIQIVPLQTRVLIRNYERELARGMLFGSFSDVSKTDLMFERDVVRFVSTILKKTNKSEVYVFTGLAHTIPIFDKLKSLGINAEVRTSFFRKRKMVERFIEICEILRKRYWKPSLLSDEEVSLLRREMSGISTHFRKGSFSKFLRSRSFIQGLKKRKASQLKRHKRKLENAKRKIQRRY